MAGGRPQYKEFFRIRSFWEGASPLALQPVEDAGLTLSPCVVHRLWRQVWLSHLQTTLRPQGRTVGRFISLTPPVGTPLLLRGALQTGIWTGNAYFLFSFFPEKKCDVPRFYYFLAKPKKRPLKFLTCYLLLATCDFPCCCHTNDIAVCWFY